MADAMQDLPVVLLNPRRDDWDSTWEQSAKNPQFREQVLWELDSLDMADLVVFYFDPNTKSPVTMLELGYMIGDAKWHVIVCCPPSFWRKGNIDIMCEKYHVPVVETLDELIVKARAAV